MLSFHEIPVWVSECVLAIVISIIGSIVYIAILKEFKVYRESIKKVVNMGTAFIAWCMLLLEKLQQNNVPFSESKLFYIAIAMAVIALVHSYMETTDSK